jgi:hypothetical protein
VSPTSKISPSWSLKDWPQDVYPGTASKGRYLVRMYRDELLNCGALARVGRDLVLLGDRYAKWLQRHTANVRGFDCAANRAEGGTTRAYTSERTDG